MKKLLSLTLLCLFFTASLAGAQWQQIAEKLAQRVIEGQAHKKQAALQKEITELQKKAYELEVKAAEQRAEATNLPVELPGDGDILASIVTDSSEPTYPRNHVLLIGVIQYPTAKPSTDALQLVKSADLGDLNFAIKDMEGLKDALVQARFCRDANVSILRNPTAHEVEVALRKMLDPDTGTVSDGDRVLIAFSGHGISLLVGQKRMDFLCFTDTKVTYNTEKREYTTEGVISYSTLEKWLDVSKANHKLLFVDACRNVPEFDEKIGANNFGKGDSSDIQNQGFFRFSSCKSGEVSWEFDSIEHSVFTHFLIEGMKGKAGKGVPVITLADLQEYVVNETAKFVGANSNLSLFRSLQLLNETIDFSNIADIQKSLSVISWT